jgi:hypothetical protein
MGKKAKLKKIRRIASQLPVVKTKAFIGEKVTGADLEKEGVKEVEGKPVEILANYRKKKTVIVPLNHNRKMKQLYNRMGVGGVNAYISAVMRHAKQSGKND